MTSSFSSNHVPSRQAMLLSVLCGLVLIYSFTRLSSRSSDISILRSDCSWLYEIESHESKHDNPEEHFSQSTQDSILHHLFQHLGHANKYYVEFGFGYAGTQISDEIMANMGLNTERMRRNGWRGVLFDADLESATFNVVKAILTPDNIVELFLNAKVPFDLDYLSIDVDSIDLWLLLAIIDRSSSPYRPRVISMEHNANFAPDMMISMGPAWHPWTRGTVYGASAAAINYVATQHGYTMIYVMRTLDLFLVRNDVLNPSCPTPPSFQALTAGKLPNKDAHKLCAEEDLERLVDVPAYFAKPDNVSYANTLARNAVRRLGSDWGIHICK